MGSAAFGARVGSVAFALGIGLATASSPGIALADDADAGTSLRSAGDTSPPNTDSLAGQDVSSPRNGALRSGRDALSSSLSDLSGQGAGPTSARPARISPRGRTPVGSGRFSRDSRSSSSDRDESGSPGRPTAAITAAGKQDQLAPRVDIADAIAAPVVGNTVAGRSFSSTLETTAVGTQMSVGSQMHPVIPAMATGVLSGLRSLLASDPPAKAAKSRPPRWNSSPRLYR
jgi:hypothetical protein